MNRQGAKRMDYQLEIEKSQQACEILDELDIASWLVWVRETSQTPYPALELILGADVVWQSAFLFTKDGDKVGIVGNFDADAINALGQKPEIISGKQCLITPHVREFFVLTGKEVTKLSDEEKIKMVQEQAGRLKTTILLKGKIDIISDGKKVAIIKAGSPFMTVGGMGDTLAGVCGALLARWINPFEAAQAGILINDLAGEIACKKLRESVMATDLIEAIPQVVKGRFLK